MDSQIAPPILPVEPDSEVTSTASFGGSDNNSDIPTRSANMPDLEGPISKLETMHEVLEEYIDVIVRPTVFFPHTDELGIPELANAETYPSKNLQDNGATTMVTPRHPLHTHPQKKPLPKTPLSKCAWKTSWIPAS